MNNDDPPDTAKRPDLKDLQDLVQRLRGPDGCPWDRKQDIPDLKQYLIEECYEVLEAIDLSRPDKLREELGDLLFHIVFIAQISEEQGAFTLADVLGGIHAKMVRRHPHVFGDLRLEDADAVRQNWWKLKQAERATPRSHLSGVPKHLPALQRAYRLGQRASQVGLDWPAPRAVLDKVREELGEWEAALDAGETEPVAEELGDLLFALSSAARLLRLNPEDLLQQSNRKFLERFSRLEERAHAEGRPLESLTPEEMDRWWQAIKAAE